MANKRLTVGSLLGVPQARSWRGQSTPRQLAAAPPLPPVKLGRGCCRSGCLGCPWAEAQRRARGVLGVGAGTC